MFDHFFSPPRGRARDTPSYESLFTLLPHLFRHSPAMNLLHRGASVFSIRKQLGHASGRRRPHTDQTASSKLATGLQGIAQERSGSAHSDMIRP